MDLVLALLFPFTLLLLGGGAASSMKLINQGNEALVERLGKYHRKLQPGLNFLIPVLDNIIVEDTVREQVLDITPQAAITKDSVSVEVNAIVYWQIVELEKAHYSIDNLALAIENIVNTTLRAKIGEMKLEETISGTPEINLALLKALDEVTEKWGVKILRVEVQHLSLPPTLQKSMEEERSAEIRKRASIAEAEGIAESMGLIFETLQKKSHDGLSMSEVLKFLVAQKYVQASKELSASPNAKIIFMDPKVLTEAMTDLMGADEGVKEPPQGGSTGNGNHN
ncbi:MAG TPA: paraslipin [Oscillatoriaceae cyanobacterium M33_DOE_052]|uniref:Paraslipin n=1 Tax=Planktothricoides sp. SpSt-374 TaxID=2282167 RepID=A0A7C3ZWP3_9CYAN|nr:paraslipin [Oscillatoriaceae cyanobacterium M33_DOE_052]